MLRTRIRSTLAAVALGALLAAAPAPAATLNLTGFETTFPKAAALCAKAGKGKLPKQLKASKAKVVKACKALQQRYSAATITLEAAVAPLRQQGKDIVAKERQACLDARRARNLAACRQAQSDARDQLKTVRSQIAAAHATAAKAYESARKAFWAAIKALKGGAAIKPDAPATSPTPTTDVPDDSALTTA